MEFWTVFGGMFLFIFALSAEITILLINIAESKVFQMTKAMKKVIKNARPIGKPIFLVISYIAFLIEAIPSFIIIGFVGIISFFGYLSDKNHTYGYIFANHFED